MEKPEKDLTKSAGGKARATALTPERKKEIAKKAAVARWGGKQATHKGSFREDFGIDVECYVLNDATKTAVITQLGMGEILGLGSGGSRLPRFVFNKTMSEFIWPELREKLENPIVFQLVTTGQKAQSGGRANGYDVTILIDICKAIIAADDAGRLKQSQDVVKQARVILNASAKAGIQGLVYKLSGYDASREEVVAAFKLFVQEEAKQYEREFPNQLYAQWQRLYQITPPVRGKPWEFKHLTVKHIYFPLAKSSGKLLELMKALKAKDGDRQKKLFQFLNELGARALRMQIGEVLGMAKLSKTGAEYERHIHEQFGDQRELAFDNPNDSNASPPPSLQFPSVAQE